MRRAGPREPPSAGVEVVDPIRIVIDTNVILSALIRPDSVPGRILRAAVEGRTVRALVSGPLLEELRRTLRYPRLRRYLKMDDRAADDFVLLWEQVTDPVDLAGHPAPGICRDPDDEPYLQTALAGHADHVVSGDGDLLALEQMEGIPIVSPAEFAQILAKTGRPR